jgi:hypothetical protein
MGFKTDRNAIHRFWQNVKDGTLFNTSQYKAIESVRRKNQRAADKLAQQRRSARAWAT